MTPRGFLLIATYAALVGFCVVWWAAVFSADVLRALKLMAGLLGVLLVAGAVLMLARGGRA